MRPRRSASLTDLHVDEADLEDVFVDLTAGGDWR